MKRGENQASSPLRLPLPPARSAQGCRGDALTWETRGQEQPASPGQWSLPCKQLQPASRASAKGHRALGGGQDSFLLAPKGSAPFSRSKRGHCCKPPSQMLLREHRPLLCSAAAAQQTLTLRNGADGLFVGQGPRDWAETFCSDEVGGASTAKGVWPTATGLLSLHWASQPTEAALKP